MIQRGIGRLRACAAGALLLGALAVTVAMAAGGSGEAAGVVRHPDQLVVLSTTDVKGKTGPCGCHVPKGGFARREAFADSIRAGFGQALLVDCGGWCPEGDTTYRAVADFQADELGRARTDAVGTSDRELQYGLGFLRAVAAPGGLPLLCANLWDAGRHHLVLPGSRLVHVGGVTVGVFSLLSEKADLGPARESLAVEEPTAAAYRTVRELRGRGASVIVLLSNLGTVESEDLANALEGIDVMIVGRKVPVLQRGRMVNHTVVCYGGEQGHYLGVTHVQLDAQGHMTTAENTTVMLGPDVPEDAGALARVKAFEDGFNERLRRQDLARAARAALSVVGASQDEPRAQFLGAEFCGRCHAREYAQWKTTPHASAWRTLVEQKKDAMPECVSCHVLGYQQPGGFQNVNDVPALANVQCESCHGMGTEHDGWPAAAAAIPERVCRQCHTEDRSPAFDFERYRPHVLHVPPALLPALPPKPQGRSTMH